MGRRLSVMHHSGSIADTRDAKSACQRWPGSQRIRDKPNAPLSALLPIIRGRTKAANGAIADRKIVATPLVAIVYDISVPLLTMEEAHDIIRQSSTDIWG